MRASFPQGSRTRALDTQALAGRPAARGGPARRGISKLPALLAAVCVAAVGCGTVTANATRSAAAPGFPLTLKAANGAVHLKSEPTAIVSLCPTVTEMLYSIGAGHQVKAVDSDSNYPSYAPITKLSAYDPNAEAIAAYQPDLVLTCYATGNLGKQLAALSVPILELPAPTSIPQVYAEFRELGKATGHLAQADREVTTIRGQISKIVAQVPKHSAPYTYYYELDQTYYSATSSTFIGRLLGLLGMKSIADAAKGAAAAGGYPQLSAEYILKANPDFIILADTVCCHQSAATVAARPGWSALTAVKKGHIIALNDDIASRWGPRITVLLQDVLAGLKKAAAR